MSDRTASLAGNRIIVVGAGVLGLATATALVRRGAAVQVFDPDLGVGSASAAAAGMIAPAMEAALEDAGAERAALYRVAAALWPEFARAAGIDLIVEGADWLGPREPVATRLRARGFSVELHQDRLHIPSEARVHVGDALRRLAAGLGDGAIRAGRVGQVDARASGASALVDGRRIEADAVVLAAGWSAADVRGDGLEGLDRLIAPVKGQIIALSGAGTTAVSRVTRGPGVYLLPCDGGVIAGATMEAGKCDLAADPSVVEQLRASAAALVPALASATVARAWAGVRGATPDGLPLAGAMGTAGVFAALAPRRNGWLLAPLVAELVAAAIAGEPPPPEADAFRPDRFGPA